MITFTKHGHIYQWVGGFGAIIKSYEMGIKKGDVRMINNELFFVYHVIDKGIWPFSLLLKSEIWWSMPGIHIDTISKLREKFLA